MSESVNGLKGVRWSNTTFEPGPTSPQKAARA